MPGFAGCNSAVSSRCTLLLAGQPRLCVREKSLGGFIVSQGLARLVSRLTERAQPTRLVTRTKESDTDASTRVASPRAQ